ncbi:unnamed protein product [Callosobruchus maculatus]|uniref:C2H2-type domain-containing protein n=2 Tax=Callosobruchus maculatus TaxID=64391 RepID=A0A653DHZ4_CALMS|nr:unnamed protein product [Callosobruchus maculatus]
MSGMEDREFPLDYFTPIVTINEVPSQMSASPKIKKIKIKIEGKEGGELSGEIVKRKRGRPKKNANKKDPDEEWGAEGKRKKRKEKRQKKEKGKVSKSSKKTHNNEIVTDEVSNSVVKSEQIDVEIKDEIKEEPSEDVPMVLPLSEVDIKPMSPDSGEPKKFKCPLCSKDNNDYTERTPLELKQHYRDSHPGKRLRQSRFSSEIYPCDVCGKEFKTANAVREHMETHSNYFYCEICNGSQKKILEHIIHMRIHSDIGLFQCLMCTFNTPDINLITDHVNNHEDLLKYWCNTCKKGFQILPWFQEHDNYHSGLKPYDCEFCGKCFLYSRYLHAHKLYMHKEDINFPQLHECVICKKQYQHKNSLKLHMNLHTGNFSICDICGKILSSKEKLKFHIRTHTGYKPYNCSYCEKSFTKKPILVEHIRIHTGERPYICDYCTKGFSQRSSLVIHMRGHTGERPYVCQFCTKGFVAKAMLNIHLKTCKGVIFTREDFITPSPSSTESKVCKDLVFARDFPAPIALPPALPI